MGRRDLQDQQANQENQGHQEQKEVMVFLEPQDQREDKE